MKPFFLYNCQNLLPRKPTNTFQVLIYNYLMKIIYFLLGTIYGNIVNICQKDSLENACGGSLCDSTGGICLKEGEYEKCTCIDEYATFPPNGVKCSYKRLDRAVPLLLEFFLPFGIGHLYARRHAHCLVKFSLFLYLILTFRNNPKLSRSKHFVNQFMVLIFTLIYAVDLLGFATGLYKDGNSINMY
jgi:hypothetical protein